MSSQAEFDAAAQYLRTAAAASRAPNNTKLEIYALFKSVTEGPAPTTKRPGLFDPTGRAKWDAWSALPRRSPDDQLRRYVEIAQELGWDGSVSQQEQQQQKEEEPIDWSDDVPPPPAREGAMGAAVSMMSSDDAAGGVDRNTLHGCIQSGDLPQLRRLLESGETDVNARDEYGFSALHLAADRGMEDAVKLLLEHGADAAALDPDGETALSLAEVSGYDAIVRLLTT